MSDRRFHILSLLVSLLGLVLFFSEVSRFSYVREAVNLINNFLAPLLEFKDQTVSELKEEAKAYVYLVHTEKENIRLRRKLNSLILTDKELSACMSELEALRKTVDIPPGFVKLRYKVSRIIYYDPSGFDLFLIIEGGRDKGFREGDLVVSRSHVIGAIESVFASTSRVITPFNEKFSSSAVVGTKPKRYIYKGGFPSGELLHVKVGDKVLKGEDVFMVDIKGYIPPFLIGKVGSVERGKDPFFKKVKVEPAVDPRAEMYVYVIRRHY